MIEVVGYDTPTGKLRLSDGSTMTQAELKELIDSQNEGNFDTLPVDFYNWNIWETVPFPSILDDGFRFRLQSIYTSFVGNNKTDATMFSCSYAKNDDENDRVCIVLIPVKRTYYKNASTVSLVEINDEITYCPVVLSNKYHNDIKTTRLVRWNDFNIELAGESPFESVTDSLSLLSTSAEIPVSTLPDGVTLTDLTKYGLNVAGQNYVLELFKKLSSDRTESTHVLRSQFSGYFGVSNTPTDNVQIKTAPVQIEFVNATCAFDMDYIEDGYPVFYPENIDSAIHYLNTGEIENNWKGEKADPDSTSKLDDYITDWELYVNGDKLTLTYECDGVNADNISEVNVGVYVLDSNDKTKLYTYSEHPYNWYKSEMSMQDMIERANGDVASTKTTNAYQKGNATICFVVYTAGGVGNMAWFNISGKYVGSDYDRQVESSGLVVKDVFTQLGVDSFNASTGDTFNTFYDQEPQLHKVTGTTGVNDDVPDLADDEVDPDSNNTRDGIDFPGGGLQITRLSAQSLANVTSYLFSEQYWDSLVEKIASYNPLQCILSIRNIPFNATGVGTSTLPLGYRQMTGSFERISKTSQIFNIGSVEIPKLYDSFVDYDNVGIEVYLPYIGRVGLDPQTWVGRTLTIKYAVDFIEGQCKALLFANGMYRTSADGNCAVSIATSGNFSFNDLSGALAVNSGASKFAGSIPIFGSIANLLIPNMSETNVGKYIGNNTPNLSANEPNVAYLILDYPTVNEPSNYARTHGKPLELTMSLATLKGFTKCKNIDVDPVGATETECNELVSLLTTGIYL